MRTSKSNRDKTASENAESALELFHPAVQEWFAARFASPTRAQQLSWPPIARGESTLLLAPTGSGKTLAAFLWCLNRALFSPAPVKMERCRAVYVSPLKALAVDVERNLSVPLKEISEVAARRGDSFHLPTVFVRTGDTPSIERGRFQRNPTDILITTPESLYLMLTSRAREALRSVETVIVDEIHALVPTKRGAHLALSLERLEKLCGRRVQRIGLSATQRPLDGVAKFLGGVEKPEDVRAALSKELDGIAEQESKARYRDVTVVDASAPKQLTLSVQVPVEDMSKLGETVRGKKEGAPPGAQSIWTSIHPELLELIREHESTLIFVNSRRLAERISGAVNDLAGETLVLAHHGSVAPDKRKDIEERLKRGLIKGLVATSSLELGIDMGAIDLVVQIEAPPSVASGMQRIGRAGHHVGGTSNGVIFPKFRADLLACAAATRAMRDGLVEAVRYPRNALDVLAQQVVATVAMEEMTTAELFDLMRRAAPFAGLSQESFEGVLDLLSGRYPSDEFSELRPRITWDRVTNRITARESAQRIAIVNGGTIPDRGLYGVYLNGAEKPMRLGELDEEMVFETKPGEAIILGASTWRVDSITHDRVLVSPAPGEPGKMPFWHGDSAGRPAEFGRHIGELARELLMMPAAAAFTTLTEDHALEANAAENLLRFLRDQQAATEIVPSDEQIVMERCRDEVGDWRICVLSPYGSRVHAPWCMAVAASLRDELGMEPETMWADEGFVIRLPESERALEREEVLLPSSEVYDRVMRQLSATALFAARFRENSARALLLPRRKPGVRTPLWQQRKRAADLLQVASRFPSFPMLLETYRECIRDIFDLPALVELLRKVESGAVKVTTVDSEKPSPFAASLLFSYVANYIYDGDAPLAERRAQALSIDQSQLQDLLGDADYRELLDASVVREVEARLQLLGIEFEVRNADGIHDLLLKLGDLSEAELRARCNEVFARVEELLRAQRVVKVNIAGEVRYVAVELAAQYRDALGTALPDGLAEVWRKPQAEPLLQLMSRYARTHGPFTHDDLWRRYELARAVAEDVLAELVQQGRLLEGEFRPGSVHREWVHPEVLQQLRRKTLAKLRKQIEPLDARVLGRFLPKWQGVGSKRKGLDAVLDAIETLQGLALPLSEWEREILPARVNEYSPADLDTLMAAGEVVWVGRGQIGERDGRVALYLAENLTSLLPPMSLQAEPVLEEKARKVQEFLAARGASFFAAIHEGVGAGFPGETSEALWQLAWQGLVTNDTFHALRGYMRQEREGARARHGVDGARPGSPEFLKQFRNRTKGGSQAQGRWSLLHSRMQEEPSITAWSANLAQQLLVRYGLVVRESAAAEDVPGGFSAVYTALKQMEERGWIRRGMFIAGLGGSQFATNAAVESLRALRPLVKKKGMMLAAVDPANPYGSLLPWPKLAEAETEEQQGPHGMSRSSGASVLLVEGELLAYLRRGNPALRLWLPDAQPEREEYARAAAHELARVALLRQSVRSGLFIAEINGRPAREHMFGEYLQEAGFALSALGFQMRRVRRDGEREEDSEVNDAWGEAQEKESL